MSAQWSELARLIVKDMVGHDDRLIGHVDLVEGVFLFLASSTTARRRCSTLHDHDAMSATCAGIEIERVADEGTVQMAAHDQFDSEFDE
tara:strand:+ start:218 stop:484 length:267 start_codon:yes stop_codon:yes gene_type:complete